MLNEIEGGFIVWQLEKNNKVAAARRTYLAFAVEINSI